MGLDGLDLRAWRGALTWRWFRLGTQVSGPGTGRARRDKGEGPGGSRADGQGVSEAASTVGGMRNFLVRTRVPAVSIHDRSDRDGWREVRPTRLWLDVPFSDKDAAKSLGARWDQAARRWYAPRPAWPRWPGGHRARPSRTCCPARTAASGPACSWTSCRSRAGSPTSGPALRRPTGTGSAGWSTAAPVTGARPAAVAVIRTRASGWKRTSGGALTTPAASRCCAA